MKFVACFIVFGNKILTLKRSANEVEGGRYGLVGGGVDQVEQPLDAMVREIFEETKLVINTTELFDLGNHKLAFNGVEVESNCYKIRLDNPFEPELDSNEAEFCEWLTIEELLAKKNLVSGLPELIEILGKDQITG